MAGGAFAALLNSWSSASASHRCCKRIGVAPIVTRVFIMTTLKFVFVFVAAFELLIIKVRLLASYGLNKKITSRSYL
jgi:hypothetical protein